MILCFLIGVFGIIIIWVLILNVFVGLNMIFLIFLWISVIGSFLFIVFLLCELV